MTDIHRSITPSGFTTIRAPRHHRAKSRSPTRNHTFSDDTDDLLYSLKPFCVIESLRAPIGALKTCLDEASSSEQAFAMRAARASKHINDWYEELCEWPWPREGGSAGFEPPKPALGLAIKNGPASRDDMTDNSDEWRGSIAPEDVLRYQERVDKIMDEMEAMDIDEMKSTVLHSHILPLSRPGTPYSDTSRSVTSALSYVKMEDLTAVITAIILYCLPILSRLRKLMNAWSMRLTVLDKIPELLLSLEDVEAALKAGWDVVAPSSNPDGEAPMGNLSKGTFNVMRQTLEPKVTKVCKLMDFMLDSLEASLDTVPDSWIDRVDRVEQSWRQWVVAGNHRIRGGAWTKTEKVFALAPARGSQLTIQVHAPSPTRDRITDAEEEDFFSSPPLPFDHSSIVDEPTPQPEERIEVEAKRPAPTLESPIKLQKRKPQVTNSGSPTRPTRGVTQKPSARGRAPGQIDGASDFRPRLQQSNELKTKGTRVQMLMRQFGEENPPKAPQPRESRGNNVILSEVNHNIVRAAPSVVDKVPEKQTTANQRYVEEDSEEEWDGSEPDSPPLNSSFMEPSILETVDEEDTLSEPDLPRYPRRMISNISMASTVIHDTSRLAELDASESFREDSMEPELELPPLADPDQPFSSDAISPPSSPPLRYERRTPSVSFQEMPQIFAGPEFSPPLTQDDLDSSAIFDADTTAEYEAQHGSHNRMGMMSEDDRLHQQIKEVLQNIPAKIKLARSSKTTINLNPPDFQAPGKARPRTSETFRRSTSAMSSRGGTPSYSRSGTPSFMLAPVREPRQRPKSSQEIKMYHLSRSTGEAPIKLFIRCVGENGERVMVRVGGGWSDLGEYLKEYAAHHGRKSKGEGKVEVRDSPQPGNSSRIGSSPASRPLSATETPTTPLAVRKTRRSIGEHDARRPIRTPISRQGTNSPSPDYDMSRMSVRSDFDEETSSLGLAGPKPARKEMSDESRKWVESVKEKVRLVSGERIPTQRSHSGSFGTISKVGGTTRLFRKN